jgi:predicted metal-dependent phosphoesterase TrpH
MKEIIINNQERLRIRNVNLHLHTRYSDGAHKPKTIVETALKQEIDIISITDHDSVDAYRHIPAQHIPLRILPGIEMSSTWVNSDVHVLGYGIDVHNKEMLERLSWIKEGRHNRAQKMLDKLSILGIIIPLEQVLAFAGEMKLIVRPHIAKALIAGNHCKTKQEAFEKYIGNEAPAFVPKPVLSTGDVVRIIHEAGGKAVIAHPGKLDDLNYLDDFVKLGIDGVEVWHPDHSDILKKELEEFCLKNKLIQTGGSDFHGDEEYECYFYAVPATEMMLQDIQSLWDDFRWTQT